MYIVIAASINQTTFNEVSFKNVIISTNEIEEIMFLPALVCLLGLVACFFVSLLAHNSKSCEHILIIFSGNVGNGTREN